MSGGAFNVGGLDPNYYNRYISVDPKRSYAYQIPVKLFQFVDRIIFLLSKIFTEGSITQFPNDNYLLKKVQSHNFKTSKVDDQQILNIIALFEERGVGGFEDLKKLLKPEMIDDLLSPVVARIDKGKQEAEEDENPLFLNVLFDEKLNEQDFSLQLASIVKGSIAEEASSSSSPSMSPRSESPLGGQDEFEKNTLLDSWVMTPSEPSTDIPAVEPPQSYFEYYISSPVRSAASMATSAVSSTYSTLTSVVSKFAVQTSENEYIIWKARRFEAQLWGLKVEISDYFDKQGIDIHHVVEQYDAATAPQWQKQLHPIMQLFAADMQVVKDEAITLDYLNDLRIKYNGQFLNNLRQASEWVHRLTPEESALPENSRAITYIDDLCALMYGSLDLNDPLKNVLDTIVNFGKTHPQDQHEDLHSNSLISDLEVIYQTIKNAPAEAKIPKIHSWINSLVGHFNGFFGIKFDPNQQSNPTHVLYQKRVQIGETGTYVIKDIAMGSPTIECNGGKAVINPEFRGNMRKYQREGKIHFYINNQNYIMKDRVKGSEVNRCEAIHGLSAEFPGTFYAITLSQNSKFYKEGYAAETLKSSGAFRDKLIAEMFDGEPTVTGNCIPDDVRAKFKEKTGQDLQAWSTEMADKIHQIAFGGRTELTVEERSVYVRLFYRHLVQKLLIELDVDSYNESCKDRIDRGAASDAEEFARLAILNDFEDDDRVKAFFNMMVFARALVVRKREIIDERLEKLLEVVLFMLQNKQVVKDLHVAILGENVKMSFDPGALIGS